MRVSSSIPSLHFRRRLLSAVMVVAACALSIAAVDSPHLVFSDPMKKQPYLLYPGSPSQMEVLWQLSATATSTLEWGPDTSCSAGSAQSDEYGTDHQHAFTIGGLVPATRYFYRVSTGGFVYPGSFTSAPPTNATRVKFFAYGDTRSDPASHDQVTAAMISAMQADPAYRTFTLFMGDFVYYGNNESYWTSEFFTNSYPDIRATMANLPYQACMGNHENSTPILYTKYFPYPWVGGRYWSFDYGPVHVTVIDQYIAYGFNSVQLQWIANDLASSGKVWKIVLLHEPGWSAGGGHANNTTVQTYIEPLCEQYGVSLVFAGHNHFYARAMVNGVAHITTGGGGAPLNVPSLPAQNVVAAAGEYHYCQIAIDGGALSFKALTPAGAVLDSFSMQRAIPDMVAPSVSVTSPNGGESWVVGSSHSVTWNASDNVGVDSVNVDYSFHGADGPWAAIQHGQANTGSLGWTVPGQSSDSALVRVTAFDHALNQGSDLSDSLFQAAPEAAGAGGAGAPPGLNLALPRPNPSRGTVRLAFTLPARCAARIDLVDARGRLMWRWKDEDAAAGPHDVRWDGRGNRGAPLPAGIYYLRLVTPAGTRLTRLVRLP